MTRLRTALALALVVGTARAQYPADDPVQFVAHCAFEQHGADALRTLCGFGTRKEAGELFDMHAQAHGWRWDIEGPDLADFGRPASCPAWVLDQLAGVGGVPCSSGSISVDRAIAVALGRNGRVEDALRLLQSGIEDVQLVSRHRAPVADNELATPAEWIAQRASNDTSLLSEWAAKIAARAGLWGRAQDFAEEWTSTSWCGNAGMGEIAEILSFRARCLLALGRPDEAIAIAREHAHDLGYFGGDETDLTSLWIECLVSSHRARDAEAALEVIRSEVLVRSDNHGLRRWHLTHMSREEQLAHVEELAEYAPNTALALLLSSGSLAIVARLGAIEVVDGELRHPAFAYVLAQTGHPDVGPVLRAASERVFSLEYATDPWTRANAQWNALAVAR